MFVIIIMVIKNVVIFLHCRLRALSDAQEGRNFCDNKLKYVTINLICDNKLKSMESLVVEFVRLGQRYYRLR